MIAVSADGNVRKGGGFVRGASLSRDDEWGIASEAIEKASEEIEKNVGVKLNDLLALPSGELSIAVVQPPGKALGLVALLDYGANESTVDKLLEAAAKKSEEEGAKKSEKDIDGTKVIVYSIPKKEEEGGDDNSENDADGGETHDALEAKPDHRPESSTRRARHSARV